MKHYKICNGSNSLNPNLTMEFIEKHPNKPWDWFGISRNRFRKN